MYFAGLHQTLLVLVGKYKYTLSNTNTNTINPSEGKVKVRGRSISELVSHFNHDPHL